MGTCLIASVPIAITAIDADLVMPRTPDYCACCGRVDRLDEYGICPVCRTRPNIIEMDARLIEARGGESMRAVEQDHRLTARAAHSAG